MRGISFLLLALIAGISLADDAKIYPAAEIQWQDGPNSVPPGAKVALLEGDLSKEAPFVMRVKLPDGYKIAAHTHPRTEHVTVLSGTFVISMDGKEPRKLKAGDFGYWEPGMKHAVSCEGETIFQVHGIGPWQINYVNPADDPRNQAK